MSTGARAAGAAAWGTLGGIIILSAWLGAALYFSIVVARAAFRVLPTPSLAGALVGQTLPALFVTGVLAGLAAAVLIVGEPAGARTRMWRLACAGGAAVSCAIGQFVIGPRIDRLRVAMGNTLESLPASDPMRIAFGRLHALSVLALGVSIILAVVVIVLGGRAVALD